MTKNKFNDYKKLKITQFGGSNLSNDKEFLNQLKKISNDLELTFSEFKKIINSKIKPNTNDNMFLKLVNQLDILDGKVDNLSKQFTPSHKNNSDSISESIKNIESNVEKLINLDVKSDVNEENKSNYCTIS